MDDMNKEIEQRVAALTQQEREHLREAVYRLIRCYDDKLPNCAVVLFGTGESLEDVLTLGCDPMHAANMLLATNDVFNFINTRGAPPKEKFN